MGKKVCGDSETPDAFRSSECAWDGLADEAVKPYPLGHVNGGPLSFRRAGFPRTGFQCVGFRSVDCRFVSCRRVGFRHLNVGRADRRG